VETDLKKFDLQSVLLINNRMKVVQFLSWYSRKSEVAQESEGVCEG
jgi:hypothetical protein